MPAGRKRARPRLGFSPARRLVSAFIDGMEEVPSSRDPYPAIEVQVRRKQRVDGRLRRGEATFRVAHPGRPGRSSSDYTVVRDRLGPASSINMAHGMAKGAGRKILALTDGDSFLHSGLPAFVNTLYNGSDYLLAIRTKGRTEEITRILRGSASAAVFHLASARRSVPVCWRRTAHSAFPRR